MKDKKANVTKNILNKLFNKKELVNKKTCMKQELIYYECSPVSGTGCSVWLAPQCEKDKFQYFSK